MLKDLAAHAEILATISKHIWEKSKQAVSKSSLEEAGINTDTCKTVSPSSFYRILDMNTGAEN